MSRMESIKCSSNQATFVLIFCCHQTPVQSLTFELIANIEKNDSILRQMEKIGQSKTDCAPAPNGLFHSIAPRPDPRCWGVLFDRVVVLSSFLRHTRTHNLPNGLPLLPQKSSPKWVILVFDSGPHIGIELHSNFHSSSARCC